MAVITRWSYKRGGRKAGFHCIGFGFFLENLNFDFPPLKTSHDHAQEDKRVVVTTQIKLNSSTIFIIISISHP